MACLSLGVQSFIEKSPDSVSLIDTGGQILFWSASTARNFGYQSEDLVGRNCLEFIHPDDRDQSSRALCAVLARTPESLQWDARVRHKGGDYSWVESTASNLLLDSGVRAMVVRQRDIDARKAAEIETQNQARELARSNLRLEEFAYTAAHDLREPLRTISELTSLLCSESTLDADSKQTAAFIVDAAARMSVLVDNLLSFALTGTIEFFELVDLEKALEEARRNLATEIKANGAILTVGPLPIVRSNKIHLVRVFQNLISNAVKYSGGRPAEIHIGAARRGTEWVVGITDRGVGIAPEDQARIFLPFVRLIKTDVPGTGLGLAACRKIVETLGGTIQVESMPGAGTTFFFTIAAGLPPTH